MFHDDAVKHAVETATEPLLAELDVLRAQVARLSAFLLRESPDNNPAMTGSACDAAAKWIIDLKSEVERLRVVAAAERLGWAGIANDEALECYCGVETYTDGNPCPRCYAIYMRDLMPAPQISVEERAKVDALLKWTPT